MIKKEQLMAMLRDLPDEFTVDDLLDRVFLLSKIERGMRQSETGQVLSHEQAQQRMQEWISRHSR